MTDQDVDALAWARERMPVVRELGAEGGLDGDTVAVASHLEPTTGVFVRALADAGAHVLALPSEPRSTDGEVVARLDATDGVEAFAEEGMDEDAFVAAQRAVCERAPDVVCSDGGALTARLHEEYPEVAAAVVGGTEQTTAGVHRIEAMADEGVLAYPVHAVNDTPTKHWFDNVHGTGESVLTNVEMTTNSTITGSTVVVGGYGHCGKGMARKARGLGAHTIVTEVDPRKALKAHMDGHRVMSMREAAPEGDLFVVATGSRNVIGREHFDRMQSGALLANAGHYDAEIDVGALADLAERTAEPRPGVTRHYLPDGRHLDLLTEGRLVNLTGPYSEGHPAEVMDMTFAAVFAAIRDLLDRELPAGVHRLPDRLDRDLAERKLSALDLGIDEETAQQTAYQESWREENR